MPVIPAALAPCGRTALAGKCRSWAWSVMNTSSSSSLQGTAATTVSRSLRATADHSGFTVDSGATLLTTPPAVASANPAVPSTRPTMLSSGSNVTNSVNGVAPTRLGGPAMPGRDTKSTTGTRSTRPVDVTAPNSPRVVVANAATRAELGALVNWVQSSASPAGTRAIRPVASSSTRHGSLTTSRDICPGVAGAASAAISTVRRGVACSAAISANSSAMSSSRAAESARMRSNSAMVVCSSACSDSSSSRENLVNRRNGMSKM